MLPHLYAPGSFPCAMCCPCGAHEGDHEAGCGFGDTRWCEACHNHRYCGCHVITREDIAEYLCLTIEEVDARFDQANAQEVVRV